MVDDYLRALQQEGAAGTYNLTLPPGGIPALGDVTVQETQNASIRADLLNDAMLPIVAVHFAITGRLQLQGLRIEGQESGVASLSGASASLTVDHCEFVKNTHESGGAIVVNNGELQIFGSLFEENHATDPDCECFAHPSASSQDVLCSLAVADTLWCLQLAVGRSLPRLGSSPCGTTSSAPTMRSHGAESYLYQRGR